MSNYGKDAAAVSLAVMVNKERNKVLFAVADNHFADILISFLTLPLGRILKFLEANHNAAKGPRTIGSLSSFYRSIANLDASEFVTDGAKQALLNPRSSFEADCERLKLDISRTPPAEYFRCANNDHPKYRSLSLYYDTLGGLVLCPTYRRCGIMTKVVAQKSSAFRVFTKQEASFIIYDDLQIFPNDTGISGIMSFLGIGDCKAETIEV
ncbi:uncharacterized protein LOC131010017 [Salvia miltiorrhiza]|uniref:uncharacterized protein LOC131010017 n=1 Tax=Salvia miltiorrhiza TaxID=226208 RepID=UPI0025ACBD5C|nr:uncharacterized protein LOC131010017 [Salvia miltiorrhiza]